MPHNDRALTLEDLEQMQRDRLERAERVVLGMCLAAFSVLAFLGLIGDSLWALWVAIPGIAGLSVPWFLIAAGRARSAAAAITIGLLSVVTLAASIGAGLHDPTIMAFAVILVFAGLTLERRAYYVTIAATAFCLAFIAASQYFAWMPLVLSESPEWAAPLTGVLVIAVTAVAVGMLGAASNEGLRLAHSEIERRIEIQHALAELSRRDSLTGVFSRRAFDDETERLSKSRQFPVSVVIVDVDDLKLVNDTFGHAAGDQLIIDVATVLLAVTRGEDMLARTGGDEFALLLPETGEAQAQAVVERITRATEQHNAISGRHEVQLSCGTATAHGGGLEAAIIAADEAMYANKAARKS